MTMMLRRPRLPTAFSRRALLLPPRRRVLAPPSSSAADNNGGGTTIIPPLFHYSIDQLGEEGGGAHEASSSGDRQSLLLAEEKEEDEEEEQEEEKQQQNAREQRESKKSMLRASAALLATFERRRRRLLKAASTTTATAATLALAAPAAADNNDTITKKKNQLLLHNNNNIDDNKSLNDLMLCAIPIHRAARSANMFGAPFASVSVSVKAKKESSLSTIDGEFMIDTGLTQALVTPSLAKEMQLAPNYSAIGAGAGGAARVDVAEVQSLRFKNAPDLELGPVAAGIADFPQEASDLRLQLNGMMGFSMLDVHDTDLDFPQSTLRFYKRGACDQIAQQAGMLPVAAASLPMSEIPGVRVLASDGSGRAVALGVLDTGSAFTCVNLAAAKMLGIKVEDDADTDTTPVAAMAVGVDGNPVMLRIARNVNIQLGGLNQMSSSAEELTWNPSVTLHLDICAVGDIPALDLLSQVAMGNAAPVVGTTPRRRRTGPAVLIGLDALERYRLVFCGGENLDKSRERTIYLQEGRRGGVAKE